MKLATLPSQVAGNRNGDLIVVSKDLRTAVRVEPGHSLLMALEAWPDTRPRLEVLYQNLNSGKAKDSFPFDLNGCLAPLPNAPGFYDGSAFLSHVVRARKSRGDVMPESAKVTPLVYQGVSDNLLPANAPIILGDASFGGDFEGEFAVITTDVKRGAKPEEASQSIALLTMFNDITLREIVKVELETKFGFLQSKPNSSFAPIVVTPDEAGKHWDGKRLDLELQVKLNGEWYGNPRGNEMHFTFPQLIAHACRTRPLSAGSIVGCGTISNEDAGRGFACLTEKRCQEMIDSGKAVTPWLKPGDRVTIDSLIDGKTLFGSIDQTVALTS